MEKIDVSQSKHFGPVCMYKSDIAKLFELLHSINPKVEIKVEDFKYESYDEFISHKDGAELQKLEMGAYGPLCSVDILPSHVHIYMSKSDLMFTGAFAKISEILISRQMKKSAIYKAYIYFPGFLAVASLLYFSHLAAGITIPLLFIALGCFSFFADSKYTALKSIIKVKDRENEPSVTRANVEKLVWIVVGCVVSAIIGFASSEFSRSLHPTPACTPTAAGIVPPAPQAKP